MSKWTKRRFRWFTMVDFEEEEMFLREQHKNGWKFIKFVLPGFYIFEECDPEDVVYRLDYSNGKDSKESYVQMFSDCGWEYMFDVNGWSYFRKTTDAEEQNNDIFSDMETKIGLLERVKQRMIPLLVIFLCCIIPQIVLQYRVSVSDDSVRMVGTVFLLIFVILFIAYSCLFIKFGRGLRKLKKKYSEGVSDSMMEFATAALPWVILGLGVAVAMVYFDRKSKKDNK